MQMIWLFLRTINLQDTVSKLTCYDASGDHTTFITLSEMKRETMTLFDTP